MENLSESLKQIHELLNQADAVYEKYYPGSTESYDVPEMQIDHYINSAFQHILVLLDKLNLSKTYKQISEIYKNAKKDIRKTEMGVDEPYLVWTGVIYGYLQAIGNSFNIHPFQDLVLKDIISILRATLYSITDKNIFPEMPLRENDVHLRIEAVLKCVFPDLNHKPSISKQIKNFEPDTGLPSVKTLIEYKFISNISDAKRVSDEVLADTRGYFSRDWEKFIYVIYETSRIKPESEWVQMLKECGVPSNTSIIVLPGQS